MSFKKKVCITGGAGFIGSNLYKALISHGHKITVFDDMSTGNVENLPEGATLHVKDVNDITAKDFDGIDVVFHCAALARVQMSIEQPVRYHKANVNGTVSVLEAARHAGVKRLIYSASSSAYGEVKSYNLPTKECEPVHPISPYALQKYIGEEYCRQYSMFYDLETVCLRYFNVYGEGMPTTGAYRTAIGIFKDLHKQNKPLTITNDGEQRRDFTYVKDVVNANILAMNGDSTDPYLVSGYPINIGNGNNYSINEIADAFGGEREYIGPVVEPRVTLADNTYAAVHLKWEPTQDVIEWINKNK